MEDRSARFRIGQLAARTGVDAERLRKWEARYGLLAPERSPGGFRIYSLDDEERVRLMRHHLEAGYAAAEAAELAGQGIAVPSPVRLRRRVGPAAITRFRWAFGAAIDAYDEGAAQRALDDLFNAFTVEAVLRDALVPFLHDLGVAWAAGEATVGEEHFAYTIIEARLVSLSGGWGSGPGRRVLLACPPGERHTLGLRVFGITLARRGWTITYLGADTPVAAVIRAAERIKPAVVVLAATRTERFTRVASELRRVPADLLIAGAGATAMAARRVAARRLTSDPVTAAGEVLVR